MKFKVVLALSLVVITTTATFAEPKPEDMIKFRQSGMMFMRWNMGIIKNQVVKNPQKYNKQQVMAAANVIAAIANSGMWALYNQKSATGKGWKETRVKPEYFRQADGVIKHANTFNKQANQLAKVANSGDINKIKVKFGKLLDACKACHKKFRSKN